MLETLCNLCGGSGREEDVRAYILSQIEPYCTCRVDALGNIIAEKQGRCRANKKILFSAHMDEVAFIITSVTEDGYLRFEPVGGVEPEAVVCRVLQIGKIQGVVGTKPVHLLTKEERETPLRFEDLLIDIGASDRKEALQYVQPGDYAYFLPNFSASKNGKLVSKALDDRAGCMLLIEMIQSDLKYDCTFSFCVQEEVGLRGAGCVARQVNPDVAVVVETTTAGDLCGVSGAERVCAVDEGAVVSFMDGRTIYDHELYSSIMQAAKEAGVAVQTKTKIAGGNDAGALQSGASGAKVAAVSLPGRYIHGCASVVSEKDLCAARKLLGLILENVL